MASRPVPSTILIAPATPSAYVVSNVAPLRASRALAISSVITSSVRPVSSSNLIVSAAPLTVSLAGVKESSAIAALLGAYLASFVFSNSNVIVSPACTGLSVPAIFISLNTAASSESPAVITKPPLPVPAPAPAAVVIAEASAPLITLPVALSTTEVPTHFSPSYVKVI